MASFITNPTNHNPITTIMIQVTVFLRFRLDKAGSRISGAIINCLLTFLTCAAPSSGMPQGGAGAGKAVAAGPSVASTSGASGARRGRLGDTLSTWQSASSSTGPNRVVAAAITSPSSASSPSSATSTGNPVPFRATLALASGGWTSRFGTWEASVREGKVTKDVGTTSTSATATSLTAPRGCCSLGS